MVGNGCPNVIDSPVKEGLGTGSISTAEWRKKPALAKVFCPV